MKSTLTADKIISDKLAKLLLKETMREKENAINSNRNLKFVNDYYGIAITYNTGLRISELADLKWNDIADDYLIVRNGKGGKTRTVYYGDKTYQLFQEFKEIQTGIMKRTCTENDYLFIGQRGALKRGALHFRFKYWVDRLGLPKSLSWHSLRHGFATRLLDAGLPLQSVRDQLGHSNISITSTYLHFTEKAKDKIKKLL